MTRVAIVTHHGRTPGGSENSLMLLMNELRADFDPEFVLFERGAFFDIVEESFGAAHLVPMATSVAKTTKARIRLRAVLDSLGLVMRLTKTLRKIHPDVVVTNSMKAHVLGTIAAFIANIPCVNFFHDLPEGFALQLTRSVSALFGHARITCSQAVADHFALNRTTVVHPPVALEGYRSLPSSSDAKAALGVEDDGLPVVSIIGRIARWKGQDRFIRIAASVREKVDARFLIVGGPVFGVDAEFLPELHAQCKELGLEDRLQFVPWSNDLRNVYAATDVAVNCSTREPFGRTTLEALASGVPSVCFNDGGTPEALRSGDSGTAVAAGDENEFSRALVEYLTSAEKLGLARAAAARDAEFFSAPLLAREFRDAINATKRTPTTSGVCVAETKPQSRRTTEGLSR